MKKALIGLLSIVSIAIPSASLAVDYDHPCPSGWMCSWGAPHDANLKADEVLIHGFLYAKDGKRFRSDDHQLHFVNKILKISELGRMALT